LLWNNDIGIWLDFNLQNNTQQPSDFYGSSVVPLWAKLYWDGYTTGTYTAQYIEQAVTQALTNYGVLEYPGGIPTSLINDGQQWDFPNGWAPLQIMAIDGLLLLGETGSQWSAKLASGWLQNNYDGWLASQLMYEKYNVTSTTGLPGNGGEYQVQSGFGWTNGVVLELLLRFCTQSSCINSSGGIQVPVQTERFKK
jgi:alpha,alpha-trehalase